MAAGPPEGVGVRGSGFGVRSSGYGVWGPIGVSAFGRPEFCILTPELLNSVLAALPIPKSEIRDPKSLPMPTRT
jgi:hypothetical protein